MADEVNPTPPENVDVFAEDNYIRYTNEDVPINEVGSEKENPTAREFGTRAELRDGGDDGGSRKLRFSEADPHVVAATFAVVSIVALSVVLDGSEFSSFFSPLFGVISESFGISGGESEYAVSFDMVLVPTDTEVTYSVNFKDKPDGDLLLVVKEGSSTITSTSLDTTISGTITNLTPGTNYQFSVTRDGTTVGATQSVTTLGEYDGNPIIKLLSAKNYNATARNENNDGGYFMFQLAVVDKGSVCTDFHAVLSFETDSAHVVEADLPLGTVTEMQKLEILDSWIPESVTSPISASLIIKWNVSGEPAEGLIETVYI